MNAETKVDVLAVMDRACTTLNDEGLFNPGDDLCKARRAVAKLIEAANQCMECELGDMACVGSYAPAEHALGLLQSALSISRIGSKP